MKNPKKLNKKSRNPINKWTNKINRQLSRGEIQMGDKHRRCTISFSIK